jgi:hypothetical protein
MTGCNTPDAIMKAEVSNALVSPQNPVLRPHIAIAKSPVLPYAELCPVKPMLLRHANRQRQALTIRLDLSSGFDGPLRFPK